MNHSSWEFFFLILLLVKNFVVQGMNDLLKIPRQAASHSFIQRQNMLAAEAVFDLLLVRLP